MLWLQLKAKQQTVAPFMPGHASNTRLYESNLSNADFLPQLLPLNYWKGGGNAMYGASLGTLLSVTVGAGLSIAQILS